MSNVIVFIGNEPFAGVPSGLFILDAFAGAGNLHNSKSL